MKKKIQLANIWEQGVQWWVVREVDDDGKIKPFTTRYFQDEDMARVNYNNQINAPKDIILEEAEILIMNQITETVSPS